MTCRVAQRPRLCRPQAAPSLGDLVAGALTPTLSSVFNVVPSPSPPRAAVHPGPLQPTFRGSCGWPGTFTPGMAEGEASACPCPAARLSALVLPQLLPSREPSSGLEGPRALDPCLGQ